jgi:sarcosine oxidase delta subunit
MKQTLEQFTQTMCIKNFSESTRRSYGFELQKYLQYCTEHLCEYNSTTFQQFLFYRIKNKQISECSLKHSIGAAKFFFRKRTSKNHIISIIIGIALLNHNFSQVPVVKTSLGIYLKCLTYLMNKAAYPSSE